MITILGGREVSNFLDAGTSEPHFGQQGQLQIGAMVAALLRVPVSTAQQGVAINR